MFFARFIAPKIREHKGERCRDAVNNLGFIEKTLRKKHGLSLDSVPNIESLENPVGFRAY